MKFLRRLSLRESKLGKNRKKKQIWRRAGGRHNKMRQKMRGYPQIVEVGHKIDKKEKGKVLGERISRVVTIKDLEGIKSGETVLIGKVGTRRKIELMELVKKKGIKVYKTNINKFIIKNKKGKHQNEPQKEKTTG